MAMNLNLTLVVQMAHFFFAYWLISRFLIKPGYNAIKIDEERLRQLTYVINTEQKALDAIKTHKKDRWQQCQFYFARKKPIIPRQMPHAPEIPVIIPHTLTYEEKVDKAQQITKALKQRIFS